MSKLNLLVLSVAGSLAIITGDLLGNILFKALIASDNTVTKNTCMQYEQAGVIKKGSCDCTEKLFKSWSESYDWKDACEVLHSRDNMATQ